MPKRKQADKTFEGMMARLSEIVDRMEGRDVPIEEAMLLFEEGHGLIAQVREILDKAEEKVKLLSPDGRVSDEVSR